MSMLRAQVEDTDLIGGFDSYAPPPPRILTVPVVSAPPPPKPVPIIAEETGFVSPAVEPRPVVPTPIIPPAIVSDVPPMMIEPPPPIVRTVPVAPPVIPAAPVIQPVITAPTIAPPAPIIRTQPSVATLALPNVKESPVSLFGDIAKAAAGVLKTPAGGVISKFIPGLNIASTALTVGGLVSAGVGALSKPKGAPSITPPPAVPLLTGGPAAIPQIQQAGMVPGWGNLAGRGAAVAGTAIKSAVKSKWVKSVAGGVVTWFLVDALGNILSQRHTAPTRRMNPLNAKALRRANRRMDGFHRAAKPILSELGYSVVRKGSNRCGCAPKKKRC